MVWPSGALPAFALSALALLGPASAQGEDEPVLVTPHFAFFSDFETNLNDRLIAAGLVRGQGKTELFESGSEAECFDELSAAERAGWNRAVDYYAEIISPVEAADREQFLPRLELAGIVADDEWGEEGRFVTIARGFRTAAAPAYETCVWPARDAANRRWIAAADEILTVHEQALASRLSEVYRTPWRGLPIRVDIVERVNWAGGHTINLRPPDACHIMISSENGGYQGPATIEMIFHEAGHFLTGRSTPLALALAETTERLGNPFYGDLKHAVNFYLTGEVVRRQMERAAGFAYTPYMYANGLYDRGTFRRAAERTLPAYLDGDRSLKEAVEALIVALGSEGTR